MHAHLLYWFKLLCKMCSPFFNSFLLCRIRNVSPILELIIRNQDACKMCKNNHIFAEPIYICTVYYTVIKENEKIYQGHLPLGGSSFLRFVFQTAGQVNPNQVPAHSTGLPSWGRIQNATAHPWVTNRQIYRLNLIYATPDWKLPFLILKFQEWIQKMNDSRITEISITFSSTGAKTCLTAWYRLLIGESNMEDTRMLWWRLSSVITVGCSLKNTKTFSLLPPTVSICWRKMVKNVI